jgi:hypothetical protein
MTSFGIYLLFLIDRLYQIPKGQVKVQFNPPVFEILPSDGLSLYPRFMTFFGTSGDFADADDSGGDSDYEEPESYDSDSSDDEPFGADDLRKCPMFCKPLGFASLANEIVFQGFTSGLSPVLIHYLKIVFHDYIIAVRRYDKNCDKYNAEPVHDELTFKTILKADEMLRILVSEFYQVDPDSLNKFNQTFIQHWY